MRKAFFSLALVLTLLSTASAEPVKVFVQNMTPKSEIAQSVLGALQKQIGENGGQFLLVGDKFEPAIQVLVYGTHAYQDIHALTVNFVVYNGACFSFYNGSIVSTTLKQAPNEASNIERLLRRNLSELQTFLH
jgi:hypothetical protein